MPTTTPTNMSERFDPVFAARTRLLTVAALAAVFTSCSTSDHAASAAGSSDAKMLAAHAGAGSSGAKCPITGLGGDAMAATDMAPVRQGDMEWWPNQLDLRVLHQNAPMSNPMGADFNYRDAFAQLDLAAVKQDIAATLSTSQAWWPADYGTYGGLMIRLAWHSAGTYRTTDGRGGSASGSSGMATM